MFSNKNYNLTEFSNIENLSILKPCSFIHACKVSTSLDEKLVPCNNKESIRQAKLDESVVGVITLPEFANCIDWNIGIAVSENPLRSIYEIFDQIGHQNQFWDDFDTIISEGAHVDESAVVPSKNVIVGNGSQILAGTIICERVIIGENCKIGPGTIVGTDAFEVNAETNPQRILFQQGGVKLGNNVEIQAKCTIVRATFGGFTEIEDNVKIDCQVHIAHDCKIGKNTRIAACAEVSGRVTIAPDCILGPNCTISNGIKIDSSAKITLGAVVTKNVNQHECVSGNFAVTHDLLIRNIKSITGESREQ